jgi:transcriptional regulator with XRE-family HTH domain
MGEVPRRFGGAGEVDGGARRRFGRLLADALKIRRLKQEDLAARLGTTQSSVSGWINGKYEPAAETIFAIERALDLEPGYLSRPLGYLPLEAATRPMSVEVAITESAVLGDEEKAALIGMYQVLVNRGDRTSTTERAAKKAVAPARARPGATTVGKARPRSVAGSR